MAIQDRTLTLKGNKTKVAVISIYPLADGSYRLTVNGATEDSTGAVLTLDEANGPFPAGTAVLDNIHARALTELRKANGLEV